VTWEFGGDVTWLEVRLALDGAGARLTLEHTARPGPHWEQFGPGAVGIGWDLTLYGLALHVAAGPTARPAQAEPEWQASDEAKAFMALSNEQWCAADIRAGTPDTTARAAAQRTIDAYTGTG
jgi:hypothetical protein